jgi:hypothetical protein
LFTLGARFQDFAVWNECKGINQKNPQLIKEQLIKIDPATSEKIYKLFPNEFPKSNLQKGQYLGGQDKIRSLRTLEKENSPVDYNVKNLEEEAASQVLNFLGCGVSVPTVTTAYEKAKKDLSQSCLPPGFITDILGNLVLTLAKNPLVKLTPAPSSEVKVGDISFDVDQLSLTVELSDKFVSETPLNYTNNNGSMNFLSTWYEKIIEHIDLQDTNSIINYSEESFLNQGLSGSKRGSTFDDKRTRMQYIAMPTTLNNEVLSISIKPNGEENLLEIKKNIAKSIKIVALWVATLHPGLASKYNKLAVEGALMSDNICLAINGGAAVALLIAIFALKTCCGENGGSLSLETYNNKKVTHYNVTASDTTKVEDIAKHMIKESNSIKVIDGMAIMFKEEPGLKVTRKIVGIGATVTGDVLNSEGVSKRALLFLPLLDNQKLPRSLDSLFKGGTQGNILIKNHPLKKENNIDFYFVLGGIFSLEQCSRTVMYKYGKEKIKPEKVKRQQYCVNARTLGGYNEKNSSQAPISETAANLSRSTSKEGIISIDYTRKIWEKYPVLMKKNVKLMSNEDYLLRVETAYDIKNKSLKDVLPQLLKEKSKLCMNEVTGVEWEPYIILIEMVCVLLDFVMRMAIAAFESNPVPVMMSEFIQICSEIHFRVNVFASGKNFLYNDKIEYTLLQLSRLFPFINMARFPLTHKFINKYMENITGSSATLFIFKGDLEKESNLCFNPKDIKVVLKDLEAIRYDSFTRITKSHLFSNNEGSGFLYCDKCYLEFPDSLGMSQSSMFDIHPCTSKKPDCKLIKDLTGYRRCLHVGYQILDKSQKVRIFKHIYIYI